MEFVVRISYAELYNEELKDLLATTPSSEGLKIVDDVYLGPSIQNITEVNFSSPDQVKQLLEKGESSRRFGVTNMNAHSSRSHVMVRVCIESRKVSSKPQYPLRLSWGKDKPEIVTTLNLVDLAGSERATKSGTTGQALKEGGFINKSLLTLGTIISNLSEGKHSHNPYRDSKLTRLLSSALGGNARTCMITCISPASGNLSESLSTLRFASRAKHIVNLVHKNEVISMKTLVNKLALQATEMDELRAKLELSRQLGYYPGSSSNGGNGQHQTDLLRDRAAHISKNMCNLRFLIMHAPKLIEGLRKVGGVNHLVKKVQNDVRTAIIGYNRTGSSEDGGSGKYTTGQHNNGDLSVIIEEHSNLISTYLPKEQRLLYKLQLLQEKNGKSSTEWFSSSSSGMNDGDDNNDWLQHNASDGSHEEDDFDFMNLFSGNLKEQAEYAYFQGEDIRATAVRRIQHLENELLEGIQREKAAKKLFNEQLEVSRDQMEAIQRHIANEGQLQKHFEELRVLSDQRLNESDNKSQLLMQRIGVLEVALGDKDADLGRCHTTIRNREGEIEKLKTQCDQLMKDLAATVASRKAFEEETSRVRSDMRIQMDRLRNNMHEMLLQGGQESKVMEGHNAHLQKELDSLRDNLEVETRSKDRLEEELSKIRNDVALMRDEQRLHMNNVTVARSEVSSFRNIICNSISNILKCC